MWPELDSAVFYHTPDPTAERQKGLKHSLGNTCLYCHTARPSEAEYLITFWTQTDVRRADLGTEFFVQTFVQIVPLASNLCHSDCHSLFTHMNQEREAVSCDTE